MLGLRVLLGIISILIVQCEVCVAQTVIATFPGPVNPLSGIFGLPLAALRDVNGDQTPDFAIGYPDQNDGVGNVVVFSGADRRVLYTLVGPSNGASFGQYIADIGDLDRDGFFDFFIGYTNRTVLMTAVSGFAIYSGRDGHLLFNSGGIRVSGRWGSSAANIGDVDGDGYPEIAVGGPEDGIFSEWGSVRIYSSRTWNELVFITSRIENFLLGTSILALGDISGDGRPDFVVGAGGGRAPNTRTAVFYGGALSFYSGLEDEPKATLTGEIHGSWLGRRLENVGDSTGDGAPEILANTFLDFAQIFSTADGSVVRTLSNVVDVTVLTDLNQNGSKELVKVLPTDYTKLQGFGVVPFVIEDAATSQVIKEFSLRLSGTVGDVVVQALGDVTGDGVPELLAMWTGLDSGRPVSSPSGVAIVSLQTIVSNPEDDDTTDPDTTDDDTTDPNTVDDHTTWILESMEKYRLMKTKLQRIKFGRRRPPAPIKAANFQQVMFRIISEVAELAPNPQSSHVQQLAILESQVSSLARSLSVGPARFQKAKKALFRTIDQAVGELIKLQIASSSL